MEHLRRTLVLFVVALAVAFNLDRFNGGSSASEPQLLHGVTFVLIAVAAVSVLSVRLLWRYPVWPAVAIWAAAYAIARVALPDDGALLGGDATFVTVTELTLLLGVVLVTHHVSSSVAEFEHAVGAWALADVRHQVAGFSEARPAIEAELARSRRYDRPLGVIVLSPTESGNVRRDWAFHDVPDAISERLLFAQLVRAASCELRVTDRIVEGPRRGQLTLVVLDADAHGVVALAERVRVAAARTGIVAGCGMAVFPDHALTLDELLNEATRQANAPAPRHAPALARIPGDDLIVGPVDLNVNGSSNGAHAPVLLQDFVPLLRPSADPAVSEDRA